MEGAGVKGSGVDLEEDAGDAHGAEGCMREPSAQNSRIHTHGQRMGVQYRRIHKDGGKRGLARAGEGGGVARGRGGESRKRRRQSARVALPPAAAGASPAPPPSLSGAPVVPPPRSPGARVVSAASPAPYPPVCDHVLAPVAAFVKMDIISLFSSRNLLQESNTHPRPVPRVSISERTS